MDEENIDKLVKQRSEEIRKERKDKDDESKISLGARVQNDPNCASQKSVDETLYMLNKVQRRSLLWKILALVLLIGVNLLWFNTIKLNKTISQLEDEKLGMMDMSTVYAYQDIPLEAKDFMVLDDRYLINADVVIKYIDSNIHYSNSGTRLYVPLKDMDYQLEAPEVTAYVKNNIVDINLPIMVIEGVSYVDFEFFRKLYNHDVVMSLDGGFVIYSRTYENLVQVSTHEEFVVNYHGMKTLVKGEKSLENAVVVRRIDDLSQIITSRGRFGYVKTSSLKDVVFTLETPLLNQAREDFNPEETIHVTWQQIPSFKANPNLLGEEKLPSVNVLSPTWFRLNINGIILSEADFRYMNQAHDKGYQVWGLFSNDFNPAWTSTMLNDEVYRKRAIAQIVFYSALYDLDGVNIDYENMYLDDKDAFTAFVAELSPLMKKQNVVLSIDVTVPGGSDQYSKVLDRYNLGKHVDYMMLMAYDEHWGSSPVSGPVASIPWVKKGLEGTLEEVPNDKVILGIPLYMRIWIESNGNVSSKAVGIKHLEGILEDKDFKKSYDSANQVNYITYEEDGVVYKIWVEDLYSIEKRLDLMTTYDLPGIASWSKFFADDEVWSFIDKYFND